MSREAQEVAETQDTPSPAPQKLSSLGQTAMQGHREDHSSLAQSDESMMTIDSGAASPETKEALRAQEITSESVAGDNRGQQAEALTRTILEREGIPDGSGGMETVNRVVPGTYDGVHGIDLIAATQDGHPAPIEVKKSLDGKTRLSEQKDEESARLEPAIENARKERERELQLYKDGQLAQLRSDYDADWNPEVVQWRQQMECDLDRCQVDGEKVRYPVDQMDDLWVKDRYIKLLKSDGGPERLQTAGVAEQYCKLESLVDESGNLIETPLWDEILSRRATVVVTPSDGTTSKKLLDQSVFEDKSKRVVRIRLNKWN